MLSLARTHGFAKVVKVVSSGEVMIDVQFELDA
jgi:hypothetical protein